MTRFFVGVALAGAAACSTGSAHDSKSTAQGVAPTASTHDWTRFGWDAARSSASTDPTGIDATNVASLARQEVKMDGTVDASAIYLHGVQISGVSRDVFFVTTTYGKTLAIDANDGAILWRFTPPAYESFAESRQITNATPVADPSRDFIYAASPDGFVQKLAVATGRPQWRTAITRLPTREKIASPLNFDRGHIIAVTGGYIGDADPYQGHVAILDPKNGALLHVWNSLCSDRLELLDPASCPQSESAIWGRAGAVVDSTTGSIFVATGNGRWNGARDWGDAVLELDASATTLLGNYAPLNTDELEARDADLGSTSPVLLGDGLVLQGGKDGFLRLLDWRTMRGSAPHRGGELQIIPTPGATDLFTAPAVLRSTGGTTIVAVDNRGTAAYALNGRALRTLWKNDNAGTSPVIAGGLAYVYDPGGALRVYDLANGRQLAKLAAGRGHWNSPIVVDGRVALPEGNANSHSTRGVLNIYRLR